MFVTLKSLGSLDHLLCRVGLATLGIAAAASRAEATPCAADSDCPAYFTCEVVGTAACATLQSCPVGASCPATPCAPTDIRACRSPACATNSDCPTNMVCYGQTTQQCAPRSEHEPADNDVDGGESRCPPGTLHSCVPRYVPPCTKAADCGDGFTCEETVALSCGASSLDAAAGSSDAGSTAQCTSMRTGQFRCQLEEHACSGTSECPAGYACAANPALASCTSASVSGEDGGAQATAASACSSMPAHVCLPPYYGLDFAAGVAEQNTFILTGRGLPERRGGMGGCAVAMGPAAAGGPLPGLGWLAPLVVLALGRRARRR